MTTLTCKLGPRSAEVDLAEPTIVALRASILTTFDLGADSELKILAKGKALVADLQVAALASGAKLMVMATKAADAAAVDTAPRERMRGFEEDDMRQRTGGLGGRGPAVHKTRDAGPKHKFHALQALPVLPPGVTPDVAAAQQRLRELSEDPAILAIMKKHEFQVGTLSEMPPEGQVGVSPECLMGLNKNAGQEILLRLRTDDGSGLRPYHSVIPVLLHELTHNVWGDHDDRFKTLCSQLTREYKERQEPGYPATRSDAVSTTAKEDSGSVLGGGAASMRDARAKAFGFYSPAAEAPVAGDAVAMDITDGNGAGPCACGRCVGMPEQCGMCES